MAEPDSISSVLATPARGRGFALVLVILLATVPISNAGTISDSGGSDAPVSGYVQELSNPTEDGAGLMGEEIAIDGDRMALGAATHSKAVTTLERVDGRWQFNGTASVVTDPTPDTDEAFGRDVAIEDDTLAVGALAHRNETGVKTGGVHLYTHTADGWDRTTVLTGSEDSWFGRSVALEGDTLFVGAHHATQDGVERAGKVFVYERTPEGWTRTQTLAPADPAGHRDFGHTLEADPGQLIVSAPFNDTATIYRKQGTTWEVDGRLTPPGDVYPFNQHVIVPISVSIHGDTALLGAPYSDVVFAYERGPSGWNQVAQLTRSGSPWNGGPPFNNSSGFGIVGLGEDTAYVGATFSSVRSIRGNVFLYDTESWTQQDVIRPPKAVGVWFAETVTVTSDRLFVMDGGASVGGSVYVFGPDTDRDGLADTHETEVLGSDPHDKDTDGDLYSDYTERFGRVDDFRDEYVVRGKADPTNPASQPTPLGGFTPTDETEGEEVPVLDEYGPLPRLSGD